MAFILNIDTATRICSVALSHDGEILSLRESGALNAHSSVLTVFVEDVFREASLNYRDLDAISVSMGPGSYTGLRIGVASAKGLCYAIDKPLIAVPTLHAIANGMKHCFTPDPSTKSEGNSCQLFFCPMIDARRMEVYCALYNESLLEVSPAKAVIVDEHTFEELLVEHLILFAGDGADKCREVLSFQPNTQFIRDFHASARFMVDIAEKRFLENRFENIAYFEPFYLKDFVAGKPKVKGLK